MFINLIYWERSFNNERDIFFFLDVCVFSWRALERHSCYHLKRMKRVLWVIFFVWSPMPKNFYFFIRGISLVETTCHLITECILITKASFSTGSISAGCCQTDGSPIEFIFCFNDWRSFSLFLSTSFTVPIVLTSYH